MLELFEQPIVSVIVPTYQCDSFLRQAIESVFNQTDCDYELIIVDDGSTDLTRPIVESYFGYHSELHYIYQENQGVCAARNHGLQRAKGEFVVFLDADDFFLPGKLAAQVSVFLEKPEVGIVHSGWRRINAAGEMLTDVRPWETVPELTLENWLRFKPVLPSAMMFRKSWLDKISGFDTQYTVAEDVDLVLRLALEGCSAAWLPLVTVGYRQHEQSAMNGSISQAQVLPALLNRFFQKPHLPPEIQLIERQVLYSTFVWVAWDLYHRGQRREMVNCLEQAWSYSPYLPMETMINWIERFSEFASALGEALNTEVLTKTPEWQQLIQGTMLL